MPQNQIGPFSVSYVLLYTHAADDYNLQQVYVRTYIYIYTRILYLNVWNNKTHTCSAAFRCVPGGRGSFVAAGDVDVFHKYHIPTPCFTSKRRSNVRVAALVPMSERCYESVLSDARTTRFSWIRRTRPARTIKVPCTPRRYRILLSLLTALRVYRLSAERKRRDQLKRRPDVTRWTIDSNHSVPAFPEKRSSQHVSGKIRSVLWHRGKTNCFPRDVI